MDGLTSLQLPSKAGRQQQPLLAYLPCEMDEETLKLVVLGLVRPDRHRQREVWPWCNAAPECVTVLLYCLYGWCWGL